MSNVIGRPAASEYNQYYGPYIDCVPDGDLLELLENQIGELKGLLKGISDEEATKLHEPYTWTIKQVAGHLIDSEKLFGWRAHRFGVGDETPVPGMEQNPYVDGMDYTKISLAELADEWELARRSNLSFFRRLSNKAWDNVGTASDNPITVRALAYLLVGHIIHHIQVMEKRVA